jgi:cob(I)alamin adenosyltransferase
MKIYTKTGDRGETALFSGERVAKNHALVETYGTVDETNSLLGLALAHGLSTPVADAVEALQAQLFRLGADLATLPGERKLQRISAEEVQTMDSAMDRIAEEIPPLRYFILPGGTTGAATLQVARAVSRRAERRALQASLEFPLNPQAMILLNRLSDYLFLLGRWENHLAGQPEQAWKP